MPEFSNYVEGLDAATTTTGTILIPVSHDGDPESMTPAQVVAAGGGGGGGSVTSVTGTTNRITSTGGATPVIDIAAAYDAIVAAKAPLVSPTFTGTPTAPTAAGGTNTTQVATTAFVQSTVSIISTTVSTTGSTITLDMASERQRMFVGSASFATGKTIAFSNATNALVFNLHLEITNFTTGTLTFGSDVLMSDSNWNGATNIYTFEATGQYEIGGTFDGTNWKIKVLGPFI